MSATRDDAGAERFFDKLARTWSDRYRSDAAFSERPARFAEALGDLPPGAAVLDFGCGTGDVARRLFELGHRVTGADLSEAMIAVCRDRYSGTALEFVRVAGVGPLPFAAASFDAVIASSVLEYVRELEPLLAEFRRVLRPGGRLVVTVPDMRDPLRKREAWIRRVATAPVVAALLAQSRWAEGARYLALSVNRQPIAAWLGQLAKAGFECDRSLPECSGPLVMLRAWTAA